MADIYIIYSSADRECASMLVALLADRWHVWWDDEMIGDYADVIERELPAAKCVVPIWSCSSRVSANVRDELALAKKHEIPILPVRIDDCDPPYGFGGISMVDLRAWDGDPEHAGLRQLLRRLSAIEKPRQKPAQPVAIGHGRIPLPALFMSVSSHETQLMPIEAVRALRVFGAQSMLVSAYDCLAKRRATGLLDEIAQFRGDGGFVLIDSGNYEASRRSDDEWSPDTLAEVLECTPHDWAFCFDVMNPPRDPAESAARVVQAVERDSQATEATVLPIIHAFRDDRRGHDLAALPAIVRDVAAQLQAPMIAVPERELGSGIIERARTVRDIRKALSELPFYQPLHVLGTGNPWSIAILAAAGADSFDGLEWCRVSVDADSGRLHHYQHFDFFAYQARVATSVVAVNAVDDDRIDYVGKVAFHNLAYFADFASKLRAAAVKGRYDTFITGWLGKANAEQLIEQVPELF
jgi:queuine/archaeosine tRNA-ribosyltransferase